MTTTLSVNNQNDIFAEPGGLLSTRRDIEAVREFAEQAIRVQLGEMVYATDRGTNIEEAIFSGSPNILDFEASARSALERIPDVTQVVDFITDFTGNTLMYRATINTVFGAVQVANSGNL